MIASNTLSTEGGEVLLLTGTFSVGVPYAVRIGDLGLVTEDLCYGGLIGHGSSCISTDGTTLEAITPIIPAGGIKIISVWTALGVFVDSCRVRVLKRSFHDRLYEFRTRWPDWYNVGTRDPNMDNDV
jgi:hypothetical protein